jgi:hypothetical protein
MDAYWPGDWDAGIAFQENQGVRSFRPPSPRELRRTAFRQRLLRPIYLTLVQRLPYEAYRSFANDYAAFLGCICQCICQWK